MLHTPMGAMQSRASNEVPVAPGTGVTPVMPGQRHMRIDTDVSAGVVEMDVEG